jgi:hypothetical protein
MNENARLMDALSKTVVNLFVAKAVADEQGNQELSDALDKKLTDMFQQIDVLKNRANEELSQQASELINNIESINYLMEFQIHNMKVKINVINSVATLLDFVQKCIEFAAKCAP